MDLVTRRPAGCLYLEMSTQLTIERLKAEAERFGFSACGVARCTFVEGSVASAFSEWVSAGHHGSMTYMEGNMDKRLNPCLLLPSARSVIVVVLNYYPERRLEENQLQFAYYAYGKDYHDVMQSRMGQLADALSIYDVRKRKDGDDTGGDAHEGLVCCDTVPVLERYWAWKAGIGWIGKNNSLIIPHAGSYFFLGVILTSLEFTEYGVPMSNYCGNCDNCLNACPTGALNAPYCLDASKCLSYLTIENRDPIPAEYATKMGNTVYGCDRCQQCCPHNRFATPTSVPEFSPSDEFMTMTSEKWHHLTEQDYRRIFKGSAVKRAKYAGLRRNIDLFF